MNVSLFGWLDRIPWWRDLSYPAKGALLRAFKAALSLIVSTVLALLTAGLLFPAGWDPTLIFLATTILTSLLQGIDKYLREAKIAREAEEELPVPDNPDGA